MTAIGTLGSEKSQGLLTVLDSLFTPTPGLTSETLPPTAGLALVCAPGELFHYADTNYILLGAVVERLAGRSWYEEAREKLFEPCGLEDTAKAVGRGHARLPSGYGERLAVSSGTCPTQARRVLDFLAEAGA